MCIVGITKIKCYHSIKTGTINVNGFIDVVTRKQYFSSIMLTIIKKTNRDNIPSIIMTGYSNWKKSLERFTSHGKSNMHLIVMEAENNNSIKDVMLIGNNKNDIRNN